MNECTGLVFLLLLLLLSYYYDRLSEAVTYLCPSECV